MSAAAELAAVVVMETATMLVEAVTALGRCLRSVGDRVFNNASVLVYERVRSKGAVKW